MTFQPTLLTIADSPVTKFPCIRCADLGYWIEPTGTVSRCPSAELTSIHNPPSPEQTIVARAIQRLRRGKAAIELQAFEVLRHLVAFNSKRPCLRTDLVDLFFSYGDRAPANQTRKLQSVIEQLRKIWMVPVGSRKDDPSGYWIITEAADFKIWFAHAAAAPITQLTTLHRLAKHNFPLFAEQMELDFFQDVETGDSKIEDQRSKVTHGGTRG